MSKRSPTTQAVCQVDEKARTIVATAEELQRQLRSFSLSTKNCQLCTQNECCQVIANFQAQLKEALASVLAEWQLNE